MQERLRRAITKARWTKISRELKEEGIDPHRPELPKLAKDEELKFEEEFRKLVKEIIGKETL
jgi:coenzyme F420-reducing hydrogenase delta subunit